MNFFYQIYYGFINFFSSPGRYFQSFLNYPPTTRALVLGVPSVLIALIAISTAIFGQVSTRRSKIDRYEGAAEKVRARTEQAVRLIAYKTQMGDTSEIPKALRSRFDDDLLELSKKDLETKKEELLREWELYLHKLIELEPSKDVFKFQLAEVATQQKKFALRRTLLDQLAPANEPGYYQAQINRGDELFRRKVYEQAKIHYENALQSSPDYVPAKFRLARTLIIIKDYTNAKKYINQIYREHLINYPNLFGMAKIAYRNTEKEIGVSKVLNQTVVIVKDHLDKNPQDKRFWPFLLQCYVDLGNFEEAERFLMEKMKDAKSDDEYDRHKLRLSRLYGRWAVVSGPTSSAPDAQQHYEHLKKSFVNDRHNKQTLRLMARTVLGSDAQAADKVRALYDPLTDPDPPAGVHIEISNYYLGHMSKFKAEKKVKEATDARDKAIYHLRQAYNKNTNDNQVRNNLAFLLIQQGENRIDEALQMSKEAVEEERKRSTIVAMTNYYDTYGHVQMAKALALQNSESENSKRYFMGAISAFHKSRQGRPNNISVLKSEAICHRAVGNPVAAQKLESRAKQLEESQKQPKKK